MQDPLDSRGLGAERAGGAIAVTAGHHGDAVIVEMR